MSEFFEKIENFLGIKKTDKLYLQYPKFKDRIIPLSMTGVTTRMFLHWKNLGVIDYPDTIETREWVRLNFFEYVWLVACKHMREYGLSLNMLKKLKEFVFADIVENDLKDPEFCYQQLRKNIKDKDLVNEYIKRYDALITSYAELPQSYKIYTTRLGSHLGLILFLKKDVSFIIHINEDSIDFEMPFYGDINEFSFAMKSHINKPMIIIPLREIVIDFITHSKSDIYLSQFELISPQEQKLLDLVQKRDFKRLEIVPTEKNDDILIYKIEHENIHGEKVKELKKILCLNQYEKIILKNRDSNTIYLEKSHLQ